MRRRLGLCVAPFAVLASCGPPPQGPRSLAAADFRVEKAPYDSSLQADAKKEQERAAREWIASHLSEVDAAMEQGNPEAAFGIVTTLHKVAIDRSLTKLDSELVQPVLARVVQAVIQKSSTTDRTELHGLLGFVDADHDAEPRAAAGQKFQAQADAQRELAKSAEASGHKLALYLHRALVDYYTMRRVSDSQRSDQEADVAAMTSVQFTVMNGSDQCSSVLGVVNDFNSSHTSGRRVATMHVQLECPVTVLSDESRRETKKYGVFSPGTSTTTKTDGHYVEKHIYDANTGIEIRSESTGHYVEGETKTTYTPESYVPVDRQVEVHTIERKWEMHGTVSVSGDVPSVSEPISVSFTTTQETWVPLEPLPPNSVQFEKNEHSDNVDGSGNKGPDRQESEMKKALESAVIATQNAIAKQLVSAARAASGEDAIDNYAAALFLDPDAVTANALSELLHVPANELSGAVRPESTFVAKSDLAFKLAEPDGISEADKHEINQLYGDLERKAGGPNIEASAGLQTSVPDRIDMGTAPKAADPSSSYGLGIALSMMGGADPGRSDKVGLLGGGGTELRLGYAGGAFVDWMIPLWLGMRVNGVGVAVKGVFGWNKLGKDESGDLWVRNAPYVGYGLDFSYLTWGSFDFAGSYAHYFRSEDWQKPDDFGIDPTMKWQIVGDEYRYEARLIHWTGHGDDPATTLTLRYASFTGDSKDGHAITLWVGILGAPRR